MLDAAQVNEHDRAHLSFSFGPYIGFWSAHDALLARGTMVIPSGGMSSLMRLDLLARSRATVLLCTPSYALRLAEVADMNGIRTQDLSIRKVIVAGEPGGSIPSTSARVAEAWNAQVYDHAGATEVGPWGFPDANRTGLYVLEAEFIAEFIQLDSDQPAEEGSAAELVLTTLGRDGCPVLRYRTGDVVRPSRAPDHNVCFTFLPGGVQGRVDDMWTIRGMNVFPSSIDAILREFEQVREYRVTARRHGALDELAIEVEDVAGDPDKIADTLHRRLGLAIRVDAVPLGSLPRFEGKARRVVDLRKE